jgi:hypothetical protein
MLSLNYIRDGAAVGLVSGLVFASSAIAQTPAKDTRCAIDVRSLLGSVACEENSEKELRMGDFIADLKEQLEPLPYAHFETLSHERQQVPLHEKAIFRVTNAAKETNTVFVEVECVSEDGAKLLIEWNGSEGASILSTQSRLTNGKNWVVGTDHENECATIISIKVQCHKENE